MNQPLQLNYNFQALLDTIGLFQGLALGTILLLVNRKKYRSTFFLGLFLIVFSLKLIPFISLSLNAGAVYPALFLIPLNFSWFLFPLFYIYTQKISVHSRRKTSYWVLYPGILAFLGQLMIYSLPYQTKIEISNSTWYLLVFTVVGIIYSWAIGLMNLKLLFEHNIEVKNTYSLVESKGLQWTRNFLIYLLVTSLVIHVMFFASPKNFYFKIFFSIIDLIAIYWVSYHGLMQRNILSVLSNEMNFSTIQPKTEVSTMPLHELSRLMEKIDEYMRVSECFVNTELTIVDVAENLKVHPKRISTAINSVLKKNFNTYINYYRISKAVALLKKNGNLNLSVEGIGNEVGFKSKSSFYSAFKKVTGTTPNKFKEKLVA